MNNVRRKIDLYIISLGLLFVFLLVILASPPELPFNFKSTADWKDLLTKNLYPILFIILLTYCFFAYKRFSFDLRGAAEIPFEIKKIENINYEHLTFLATYVVPLISFNFNSERQIFVLIMLLFVMGAIYIKTDLFYANPSLAIIGFHIYRADGYFKNGERKGLILICRGRLKEKQKVSYIKLDERIYYVQGRKQ